MEAMEAWKIIGTSLRVSWTVKIFKKNYLELIKSFAFIYKDEA